jgi:DNA-binding SARP family transcriptional activator
MLALYRSGRQADALQVYREGRRQLVAELGIEPGNELQELEHAILRHERELDTPPFSEALQRILSRATAVGRTHLRHER